MRIGDTLHKLQFQNIFSIYIVSLREKEVGWVNRFNSMKLFRDKYKVGYVELGLVELLIFIVGLM